MRQEAVYEKLEGGRKNKKKGMAVAVFCGSDASVVSVIAEPQDSEKLPECDENPPGSSNHDRAGSSLQGYPEQFDLCGGGVRTGIHSLIADGYPDGMVCACEKDPGTLD